MPAADLPNDSFGEFVAAALPSLLRFGHVLTGDPRQAEDLVQETLARTLRRWRSVRREDASAYARKVMVHAHISKWRRWEARVQLGEVPDRSAAAARPRRGGRRGSHVLTYAAARSGRSGQPSAAENAPASSNGPTTASALG